MKKIKILIGSLALDAQLNNTKTAKTIYAKLPLKGKTNVWGEEIYFSIPVKCPPENPKRLVGLGDLCYWMPGPAFCIFFGPTPSSCKGEIRPASPVNVIGRIDYELLEPLKQVEDGVKISVVKAE
ncbi:MAG: cyclophilin-like fold protein [Candidatus Firestonebacteria bacterium]